MPDVLNKANPFGRMEKTRFELRDVDYFGVVWNKTTDKTLVIVDDPPIKDPRFGD